MKFPKPAPRASVTATLKRQQARKDRRVYEAVTLRDGSCRVCGNRGEHRHHLRGRQFTTTADVVLLCADCHEQLHVRGGGKALRLYGNADDALTLERRGVDGVWQLAGWR